jgi:hypothetical protein
LQGPGDWSGKEGIFSSSHVLGLTKKNIQNQMGDAERPLGFLIGINLQNKKKKRK